MVFNQILTIIAVSLLLWCGNPVKGVEIGNLPNEQHGISGTFHILNPKTIYIEDFNYDGQGPGAWFYYFPPNVPVSSQGNGGYYISLASTEFGQSDGTLNESPFVDVDVTATLPDGVDACDIGTFVIWCDPFNAIFSRIEIPRDIFENDGVGNCTLLEEVVVTAPPPEFDNCIVFHNKLQLSWRVREEQSNVRFRLCGCQSTVASINQYMGFGLSGSNTTVQMMGADATIAWVDPTDGAQAVDYYLSAYTQCRDGEGACPDTMDSSGSCTNDVFDISGSVDDGVQCVSFTRNLSTADSVCDKDINPSDSSQYIVWSVGAYGETAFKHFINALSTESPIHLGRTSEDECDGVDLVCEGCSPYVNEKIVARENTTFDVTVGPSGNERGYTGITGRAGWGIAFFINGTIIPELTVVRGQTYTFRIYGGTNPDQLSNYHPLYITDSIGGGRSRNTIEEQNAETVYAGYDEYGNVTAVGDLCQLSETSSSASTRESCTTNLNEYIDTLSMSSGCTSGTPGILEWTPDSNTPDLVYYQCAVHLNLGWKINVVDENKTVTDEPPTEPQTEIPTGLNDKMNNCIPLDDQLQLSWNVNQALNEIRFRLCGCHSRTSEYNQYMGFGLSGSPFSIQMKGGDVTLAWVDDTEGPMAVDYYLNATSPCDNNTGIGACPDTLDSSGSCTNNVFNVEGFVTNGVQCVLYTRNLTSSDTTCDSDIDVSNTNQYVIWAIGQYTNNLPRYHSSMKASSSLGPVHFGRSPDDQCTGYTLTCQGCSPFVNDKINTSNDSATFEVTVGPSAYERGYTAITGNKGSSNFAFYINNTLIPELTVHRGRTYTFLVNGGNNPSNSAYYYQFYITSSRYGGRLLNSSDDDTVYAGINQQGTFTAGGRLCQLEETQSSINARESCSSLDVYIDTLMKTFGCNSGQPGVLEWTPDNDTPDLVYYQSANHLNMGWRINVIGNSSSIGSGASSVCSQSLVAVMMICITMLLGTLL